MIGDFTKKKLYNIIIIIIEKLIPHTEQLNAAISTRALGPTM